MRTHVRCLVFGFVWHPRQDAGKVGLGSLRDPADRVTQDPSGRLDGCPAAARVCAEPAHRTPRSALAAALTRRNRPLIREKGQTPFGGVCAARTCLWLGVPGGSVPVGPASHFTALPARRHRLPCI